MESRLGPPVSAMLTSHTIVARGGGSDDILICKEKFSPKTGEEVTFHNKGTQGFKILWDVLSATSQE